MVLPLVLTVASAKGEVLYFQGFETDTSGWTPDTSGSMPGTVTQVASGGGTLGLTAPDGTHYAEVTNSPNAYQPGYGTGGYSFFGYNTSIPPYPGNPVSQSMDIYINTALSSAGQAFWVDASPSSTDPNDAGSGGVGYGGEHNFRLTYTGSAVDVTVDGDTATDFVIGQSGWYNFQFVYSQSDSTSTGLSNTTLNLLDTSNNVLFSEQEVNNSDGETLQNQYLAGPGYIWLPVWQDGFSGDTLGIDDVEADVITPEPGTFALFGLGVSGLAVWHRRIRFGLR